MKAIVLLEPRHDPSVAGPFFGHLLGEGWDVTGYCDQNDVPDDVAAEADCIIAALSPVDATLIKRCPNLKLIQVPGHGFDHVDVADARAAGVPVATVASSGAEAHTVAEWTILTAGAMSRRLVQGHNAMARGEFANMALMQAGVFELAGKTIGIVGLGRIGREVAKRARGFDMKIVYFDPVRASAEVEREVGVEFRSLDELVAESDVITLHVPATPDTVGMIGARQFESMKPQAIIVNTARGSLIDHDSFVEALRTNRIRGAALDVFETEPPSPDDPLLSLSNVTLSPHMGGVTAESLLRILIAATANCNRLVSGEDLRDIVGEGGH
ncbi:MAG: 2-hydroxyacid dehydrogenase [Actinomycetota bacterium]